MAPGRKRDPHKERQWRRWIELWKHSDCSVTAFCARHHLSTANFYAWRNTLQQRDAQHTPFVPIQLLNDEPALPAQGLEVLLPDGAVLRVPPRCDAATLRLLLALLREEAPC
jgi:hypothetical protein